ncbi:unnamed protein product [Mytilus edulis]|uniref:Integrase catalytic domain-containing protein n=1 Tax=Mytilus edulis TaxID=6550 RepID=A0A8S3RNL8_MYTED|nr:unnamed protein product [Mytilus edulis]
MIGQENVRFLVDTGSTISLLNLEMYSSITEGKPGLYPLSKNNLQFETVSGEIITSLGTISVDIKVGVHVFTQQVVVADIPESGILGVDFLDKFGAQMDFKKKTIYIDGNAFHLSSDTRKLCCKVSLSKDTYIPPNSEIITTGKIRFRGDWFPEGQIEPLGSLLRQNYSVLMARTLVNTVGNCVPIRLMNISDEPCTIPRGMGVGLVHTVQICQQLNRSSDTPRDPLLQSLLEEACVDLDDEQKQKVEKLLDKYSDIFLDKGGKLGRTDILQHVIDTGDSPPIKLRPYRLPIHKRDEIDRQVQDMLKQGLKHCLIDSAVLNYPDFSKPFILDTDASDTAVGAVLSQLCEDGLERVVAFYSTTHSPQEINYSTTRKELLAVIKSIKHFKHYLYGQKFIVRTDHGSLTWLRNFKEPHGQVARWLEFLANYDIQFEYRPGVHHQNADALSRYPKVSSIQIQGFTAQEVLEAQRADSELEFVIAMLKSHVEKPPFSHVSGQSSVIKAYWNMWEQLELVDDVLYRKWFRLETDEISRLVMAPKKLRQKILTLAHDDVSGGHLGITKTVQKVRQRFYWVNLQSDVTDWIKSCPICCARKNPPRKNRAEMENIRVGEPLERVAMDITGPFPITKFKNRYVLVLMDYFTKWVEAYPIPDMGSCTVARYFCKEFISRFGVPRIFLSDQGPCFGGEAFQQLCDLFGIHKTRTSSYHPMTDGLVEKMNHTLKNVIASYIDEGQTDWDEWLPFALMAIRSSVQETTGMTPNKLMFGREINIPLTLLHEPLPSSPPSHIEYIGKLQDNINKAYDIVRGHMKTQQKRQKVNYDLKQSGKPYKENDLVWLFTPRKKKGLSPKLQKFWVGPYRIVKKLSDANYMIQLEGSLAKRIVHYNRLKIYVTPHPDRTLVKKPIISPPQRPLSSGEGSETEDMSNDESGNEEGVFDQQPQTPPSIPGRRRRLPPRRFRDYVFY